MMKMFYKKDAYKAAMEKGTAIVRVDDIAYVTSRMMSEGTTFEVAPLENGVFMVTVKRKAEQKTA